MLIKIKIQITIKYNKMRIEKYNWSEPRIQVRIEMKIQIKLKIKNKIKIKIPVK